MAPPPLKKEPSHFEVLSLTPTSLDGQDAPTQTKTVKQAYRRALLKHHPDKNQQAKAQNAPSDPSGPSKSSSSKKDDSQHFTVDQITTAYTVLSDSRQRREYIRSLKTQSYTSSSTSSSNNQRNASSTATQNYNYHKTFNFTATPSQPQSPSGVETVDLDDVAWDGRKQVYYQTCSRCGTERGYCFRELDLEEVGEDGELMVQCTGCSLWLRVLFEDADDDEDEEEEGAQAAAAAAGSKEVKQNQGNDLRHVRSGSASGKSGGWSWKFNFGISIGGGASASASAGRG